MWLVRDFNPSAGKARACGSLSLRLTWSTEEVQGQPSLDSESNHQTQEAAEDRIKQGSHGPAPASNRTW